MSEARPTLEIVGSATAEEVAALVAVVASLGGAPEAPAPPPSEWAAPRRRLRVTHPHGPGAWRASGLP